MLPKEYLKNILPDDIYKLYEYVKNSGYKNLIGEKVNENRDFYTELYLLYLDNKTLFIDNLKNNIFGSKYVIHDNSSSDWCSINLYINNMTIHISISGFIKYYHIYYHKNYYNSEEKKIIQIFEEYLKNYGYKKYDNDKFMLVTMDILGYQFETKEDLLKILKKEYKKLYSGNNYFLSELNNTEKNNLGENYRERDFKMFMYDELNQGKYMNLDHLLFCGDSMF